MTIEAVPINFQLENERYLTPTGVADEINSILETGTYVGHLVIPKPTYTSYFGRQTGDVTQGIVVLIDKPNEESTE